MKLSPMITSLAVIMTALFAVGFLAGVYLLVLLFHHYGSLVDSAYFDRMLTERLGFLAFTGIAVAVGAITLHASKER